MSVQEWEQMRFVDKAFLYLGLDVRQRPRSLSVISLMKAVESNRSVSLDLMFMLADIAGGKTVQGSSGLYYVSGDHDVSGNYVLAYDAKKAPVRSWG